MWMTVDAFYDITDPYELLAFIHEHGLEGEFEINDIQDIDGVDEYIDDWVRREIDSDYWFNIARTLSDLDDELDRDYDNYVIYGIENITPLTDDDFADLLQRVGEYAESNDLFDDVEDEDLDPYDDGFDPEPVNYEDPEEFQGEPITDSEFNEFVSEFAVLTA